MTNIMVTGACGRMGKEVLNAVWNAQDLQLVAAIDTRGVGTDIGTLIGVGNTGIVVDDNLSRQIKQAQPDVLIDFTSTQSALANMRLCLQNGVRCVVGTTGMSTAEIKEMEELCAEKKLGSLIAPNFTIGAILMMRFAAEAAKYMPNVEIIELHHDQKLDAPSGTAVKTAEMIMENRPALQQGHPDEYEKIPGSRGGEFEGGIHMHSVRLPGYFANQEVIFGAPGQTLTIRHDSISREAYMPGVLLAVRKVGELEQLVYGLDKILFAD